MSVSTTPCRVTLPLGARAQHMAASTILPRARGEPWALTRRLVAAERYRAAPGGGLCSDMRPAHGAKTALTGARTKYVSGLLSFFLSLCGSPSESINVLEH
jgi:hypothetical protein